MICVGKTSLNCHKDVCWGTWHYHCHMLFTSGIKHQYWFGRIFTCWHFFLVHRHKDVVAIMTVLRSKQTDWSGNTCWTELNCYSSYIVCAENDLNYIYETLHGQSNYSHFAEKRANWQPMKFDGEPQHVFRTSQETAVDTIFAYVPITKLENNSLMGKEAPQPVLISFSFNLFAALCMKSVDNYDVTISGGMSKTCTEHVVCLRRDPNEVLNQWMHALKIYTMLSDCGLRV